MNITLSITTALLVFAVASCSDSSFTGSNASKKKSATTQPTYPTTTDPNGSPSNPGTNIINTPNGPTTINNGDGNGNGGGLAIEWGSLGQSWHIGDGDFSGTGCKSRVSVNFLDNQQEANFYFTVLENSTTVQIEAYHCGVDEDFTHGSSNNDKDTVSLVDINNQVVGNNKMVLNHSDNVFFLSTQRFPNQIILNAGTYKVKFYAGVRPSDGDRDDIVVRAKVTGNKPLQQDKDPKGN